MTNKEAAGLLRVEIDTGGHGAKMGTALRQAIRVLDPFDYRIESCLDGFNFNRVAKAMEVVNWRWTHLINGGLVPVTPAMLKERATGLMQQAIENTEDRDFVIGTGGLEVSRNSMGELSLKFVFEDSNSN